MDGMRLFWGDSHANLHENHIGSLADTLAFAREMVDFLPMAYYPFREYSRNGFIVEDYLPEDLLARQWRAVCEFAAASNRPGELVVFPGYEWQGDATSGDHNVFFLHDNPPLIKCDKLRELYGEIDRRGLAAMVIPHHTAYMPGIRGKDWSVHDERLSPFAEIYSHHGSSEDDGEWIGMRVNRNMGPNTSGGTIEDGLGRGYKLGIICSNDSHNGLPAVYGIGTMACYARELTREALWEGFAARRVYGVTGDRVVLDFSVNGAPMGSVIRAKGPMHITAGVRCTDALDRIELLRNNRVIATHCHNGTWGPPSGGERIRCKLRVEAGWNPNPERLPNQGDRHWHGRIEVPDGVIVSVEKCWRTMGQRVDKPGGRRCDFEFRTEQGTGLQTESTVFELEARPADKVVIQIDNKRVEMSLAEAMRGSRLVDFMEENFDLVGRTFGIDARSLTRKERIYFLGPKCKIHRAVPAAGLVGGLEFVEQTPPAGANHYRIRVTQRNRQMAWSSPVWVEE
ncbi:MAG: hypothetical protein ACE15C_09180 [Phycisphaerae bacterium]